MSKSMTKAKHIKIHKELHKALDQLVRFVAESSFTVKAPSLKEVL